MPYGQTLLVALVMLSLYGVLVLGASVRRRRYDELFVPMVPSSEASKNRSPFWNPRLLIGTPFLTGLLFLAEGRDDLSPQVFDALVGYLVGLFGTELGRHLSHLLIFRYLEKNPQALSGQVHVSRPYALNVSLFQVCLLSVPLAILAGLSRDPHVLGATFGVAIYAVKSLLIIRRAGKPRSENEPVEPALRDPESPES